MRTDPHRPGAIIPAEYEHVLWYAGATTEAGWPVPSQGINCELDRRVVDADGKILRNGEHDADGRCCVVGLRKSGAKFAATGGTGSCSVCSTWFVYGEIWKHTPTGEHINVGHVCAEKYGLLRDRSEIELLRERRAAAKASHLQAEATKAKKAVFFAANPGLEAALALKGDTKAHGILADLSSKLSRWELSPKQIALAFKLANEIKNPPPAEKHVPAPEGRTVVEGLVISAKTYTSDFGDNFKATVKVETPEGSWLAWVTIPASVSDEYFAAVNAQQARYEELYVAGGVDALEHPEKYTREALGILERGDLCGWLRGKVVSFTATLTRGNEPHFAFGKRPTKWITHQVAQEAVNV